MYGKPLPNKSTKGLNIFLRFLLIGLQMLIPAFIYALTQQNGRIWIFLSAGALAGGAVIIIILEKTLHDDSIIRNAYNETQTFSVWRFVRLVFLGAGFWVIISALREKIQ